MYLIAGLGNPGAQYALTRHNIGFMAVDVLAGGARFSSKFQGQVTQISLAGEALLLLKPETFMNCSGRSVQAAASFYKIPPERILVLHDELALALGTVRVKRGGGANGHNGIKDIDAAMGPDYWRVRFGIGHPGGRGEVHDYVLGRFRAEEQEAVADTLAHFVSALPRFWQESPQAFSTALGMAG